MNVLPKKLILPSLATLLLFNGLLFSDDEIAEKTPSEQSETSEVQASMEEHVSVRSREIDPEKRRARIEKRHAEQCEVDQEPCEAQQILRKAQFKLAHSSSPFMLAPREPMVSPKYTFAAFAFPINCHWLISIGDNGRTIEMEDGSHWEISPSDAYVLRSWRREDSIIVTPNYSWFCPYDYYITNKSNNTYVKANLYVGPLAFGPYSHWIVDIDYFGGHVFLENQMVWCIDPQDSHIMRDWAVNDHVIIGLYDSWFSPYDHILINVNMDDNVRVKQY